MRARYIDGELRSHYPDLLFKVQLEERAALIYLLFEHKSHLAPLTPWQLLRETVHFWHDWLNEPENANAARLPLILPLVLYHGEREWRLSPNFADLLDVPPDLKDELTPHLPAFEHLMVDLHALPMEQIRGSLEVRAILALLKAVSEGREAEWIQTMFEPLARVLGQQTHLQFLQELLIYLAKASGRFPASTFRAAIANVHNETARNAIMTLADELKQEGRVEGRQEGRQEGREEGREQGWQLARREAVLRVLEKRFGLVPADLRTQIQSLTARDQLEHALDLALSVPSLSAFKP